jgi:hypothetical protein
MMPASELPPGHCAGCGKPRGISREDFARWFKQSPRSGPFVPLAVFLRPYCSCPKSDEQ